ncbi:class I SAM-dependent methyltransferase [Burkholderiales bacterium]|nr:class I SAM-dependent methyltransferase [Burkholderiales bacterium]
MQKPFSPACERNQDPILAVIKPMLKNVTSVLEIGSGSGQHAAHFAKHIPWVKWQCSDVKSNLSGIQSWIDDANLNNLLPPFELDVSVNIIQQKYDAIYTCNTIHIMSEQQVMDFFKSIATATMPNGRLIIYGPFNYGGRYTSDSNADFDRRLKADNSERGIRDFEWVEMLAQSNGFNLTEDIAMPANNRLLQFN